MTPEDVEQVHHIEVSSFPSTSWKKESFLHELIMNKFAHYFVMETPEEIIGYCGLWMILDQSQVTTIAVKDTFRGQGLGEYLLNYIKDYCAETTEVLSLEVNVNNTPAKKLYEKTGFNYGGIRKNYYGPGKDAHVMWVNFND
jgi:ribosomal-protein-alanine N-acetyltransferase